jgi:hypothetical protein
MYRRIVSLVVLCILVLACVPASAFASGCDATISGVLSGPSGPIASAQVLVEWLAKGGLPRRAATLTTAEDGSWSYTGRAGDTRLTFAAAGYESHVELLKTEAKQTYELNVALPALPPPTGTITGRITNATGLGLGGYVYFFRQNTDGTWPTGYIAQTATAGDGTYSSGPLDLGTYKVRLFTVHTGVQWYQYASTIESATPIVLDTGGQVVSGVDAVYPPPAQ